MDFHGMKMKRLQRLCKKHGIPANLKNVEMATRLASLFQKEDEATASTRSNLTPRKTMDKKCGSSQYQSHHASFPKVTLKDDSAVWASHVSTLDSGENTMAGTEITIEPESNVPFNSHVLALPAEGDSHLEVSRTCSMASEESAPSTHIQNQINDAMKELAVTDKNETDELTAANVTKNVNSSGDSSVSGKTSVLGGTEDEHLGYHSVVDSKNTCEKSGHKFLTDEATDPVATAFEKHISLTLDEFTLQKNKEEEAANEKMVRREATPSPKETLNEPSENREEYVNIEDISKVVPINAGHCVNRETLNEVNDDSPTKSERTISSERGCKPNALELSGSLSTDFSSLSPNEENTSECLEEDEGKALSQPIPINKAASVALGRSPVSTISATPERNLMLTEQLSESAKICAVDIVNQHNDEAVEYHAVVFTTPEEVLLLGDSGLDGVGKEEKHTATDSPDESDVLNTSQNEAKNVEESIVMVLTWR